MQKGRADGVLVHVEVLGEDEGHLDGVVDVGLSGAAALVAVEVRGKAVGALGLLHTLRVKVGGAGLLEQAKVCGVGHGLLCRLCLRGRELGRGLGVLRGRLLACGSGAIDVCVHGATWSIYSVTVLPKPGVMGLSMWARSSSHGQENTQSANSLNSSRRFSPSR